MRRYDGDIWSVCSRGAVAQTWAPHAAHTATATKLLSFVYRGYVMAIATQAALVTSNNQKVTSNNQKVTSNNQKVTSNNQTLILPPFKITVCVAVSKCSVKKGI